MSAALGLLVLLSANPVGVNTGSAVFYPPDPARLDSFRFDIISSPQYVGDSFSISITANYPYSGNAGISTTRGAYVYPALVQFSNGVCNTKVVVTLAESLALQCFAGAASGTSNIFEVLPGKPSRLIVILPGEQLAPGVPGGRSGLADSHVAGDTFSFDVYLTDSWNNPIALRSDSVYFGSDDRFAQLPAGGELSNGTGSFFASLRAAGQRRIMSRPADSASISPDTSSAVTVIPGPFAEMLLVAPGETLTPGDTALQDMPGKSGAPDPQYLRTSFDVTVYPCDRCWNLRNGPGDTISLEADLDFAFFPALVELRDAVTFSVRANTAGPNQGIWVVDKASGQRSYATRLTILARGSLLEVTAPDTIRAGETTLVQIRVRDANGDTIVAARVLTSVVKGSGRMLESLLFTDDLGSTTAHFLCTPATAERDSIRVSSGDADTAFGIFVTHVSDSLLAYPNPFGSINRDQTAISYYLQRSAPITLTIYDPFGNEVWTRRFNQNEMGAKSGDNVVYWDGTNNKRQRVANGIYLIQVVARLHTGIDYRSTYRIGVIW
jgi:hypothetical protein